MVWNRADAEEILQEAFLRLHNRLQRRTLDQPEAFLRRIVINLSIDRLRRLRPELSLDEPPDEAASRIPTHEKLADIKTPRPDEASDQRQRVEIIQKALEGLPIRERAAFTLREFENLAYQDIAECLEATMPQVKTWIYRARKKLAVELSPLREGETR